MQPKIAYLQNRLNNEFLTLSHVSDVRQWGFMVGIELVEDRKRRENYPPERRIGHNVVLEARKHGVLIRPLSYIIILMPPLTIADYKLKTLLDVTYNCIRVVTESWMGKGIFYRHGTDTAGKTFSPADWRLLWRESGL
jgi:adenosylmethionine-8-amino-7-oxononanoate aminotransferase